MFSAGVDTRIAREMVRMNGVRIEAATYHARADATAVAVDHALTDVRFLAYNAHLSALHSLAPEGQALQDDLICRIPYASVTWLPTTYDLMTRILDSTSWRVLQIRGGPGRPWYLLHVRKARWGHV